MTKMLCGIRLGARWLHAGHARRDSSEARSSSSSSATTRHRQVDASAPLWGRPDHSQHPLTCQGITTRGEACQRALGVRGALYKVKPERPFCFQHVEQAYWSPEERARQEAVSRGLEGRLEQLTLRSGDGQCAFCRSPVASARMGRRESAFCRKHEHMQRVLDQEGFTTGKGKERRNHFADWIPDSLSLPTQIALRLEMQKPISASDRPGWIYVFELVPDSAMEMDRRRGDALTVQFKVGRTNRLDRRLQEWTSQCGHFPRLREHFPSPLSGPPSLSPPMADARGAHPRPRPSPRETGCPFSHRLERLIHIHLSDRYRPRAVERCQHCGSIHREIFTLQRSSGAEGKRGRGLTDDEWKEIRDIVLNWLAFLAELQASAV